MAVPLAGFMASQAASTAAGATAELTGPLMRPLAYLAEAATTNKLPGPMEAFQAYTQGLMGRQATRTIMANHGIDATIPFFIHNQAVWQNGRLDAIEAWKPDNQKFWDRVLMSQSYVPSIDEIIHLERRKIITPELGTKWLKRHCDNSSAIARAWKETKYEIPGPADLIRFAVREAFSPDVIQAFGYHKEFPIAITPWMEKQGYGQSIGVNRPIGATDNANNPLAGEATWSDLYWYSHWDLPSLTQGYEMLHQLYPVSPRGKSPRIIGNNSFDTTQLELLQRAQDIPEFWRSRLQAISFHPINKTDANYLYDRGMIDDDEFYHITRANGYNDRDSELLLELEKRRRDEQVGINPDKFTPELICNTYQLGILTDDVSKQLLQERGFNQSQADRFLAKCKTDMIARTAKEQLAHLRNSYYLGIYNNTDLEQELQRIISNDWVREELMKRWKLTRTLRRKNISWRENIRYFKNGLIDEMELTSRLYNLGYESKNITLMVGNAKLEVQAKQVAYLQKQAKAMALQQKAAAKAALDAQKKALKAQEKQAKIVSNKANKRLRAFIRVSSDANLVAWYKAGLIELWEVYYRLYYKDYSNLDARRWIATKLGDIDEEELNGSEKKATTQYDSEGNPPIPSDTNP